MALGSSVTDDQVRTALGESGEDSYDIFLLCTSSLINKWSKYKPVRDAGEGANWPSADYYGLDLQNNWAYKQPRGGSIGGSPDEPGRLDDFRGYKHDALPPIQLTTYPGATVLNVNSLTFAITVNENDITIENLAMGDWYFGVKLIDQYDNVYWYSATNPLSDRATEIGARTVVINGLEGSYSWETFISSFPVNETGEEPLVHLSLPEFGEYVISGSTTITLQPPYINVVNNITGLTVSLQIQGGAVYLYALCTWTGVAYFYIDGNPVDNYVFYGSDITEGVMTQLSPPVGWGEHYTVVVDV